MCIQLFRERLSYKRRKAYATMSKVIMGNDGFYGCFSEPQGVLACWKETAQTRIRFFSLLVAELPWTSIKQSQTLTTHGANRHCRVRFYTFLGQPLSKQLYLTNRFHVAVRLFSNRSQMTSKCGKNKKVVGVAECVTDVLTTFWRLLWSITESDAR